MISHVFLFVASLAPAVCAALLLVTGAGKLFGRRVAQLAANTILLRVLNDGRRATLALRTVGAVELVIAAALLAAPRAAVSGVAAATLGVGFTGYLGYARATAPESSCGCSARSEGPIGWRAFTRAGLVVAFGLLTLAADRTWWSAIGRRPLSSVLVAVVAAAVLMVVSDAVDQLMQPLRKTRLKLFGHPLAGSGGEVPVAASVELLERSLAWVVAAPIVRSGLLDHWDEDGWRILRYTGVYENAAKNTEHAKSATGAPAARPVNVLFALDLAANVDNAPRPAVRVTVIDDITNEVVQVPMPPEQGSSAAPRTLLPLAEQPA